MYIENTPLKRLVQDLEDMAAALRLFIQEEDAAVGPRHLLGSGSWPPPISLTAEMM